MKKLFFLIFILYQIDCTLHAKQNFFDSKKLRTADRNKKNIINKKSKRSFLDGHKKEKVQKPIKRHGPEKALIVKQNFFDSKKLRTADRNKKNITNKTDNKENFFHKNNKKDIQKKPIITQDFFNEDNKGIHASKKYDNGYFKKESMFDKFSLGKTYTNIGFTQIDLGISQLNNYNDNQFFDAKEDEKLGAIESTDPNSAEQNEKINGYELLIGKNFLFNKKEFLALEVFFSDFNNVFNNTVAPEAFEMKIDKGYGFGINPILFSGKKIKIYGIMRNTNYNFVLKDENSAQNVLGYGFGLNLKLSDKLNYGIKYIDNNNIEINDINYSMNTINFYFGYTF